MESEAAGCGGPAAMKKLLVLADDLTGALEAGALIEGSVVALHTAPAAAAAVIDTETRHAAPEEARRRVAAWVEQIPAEWIYKKTDSALRGNIGAELSALPAGRIHYAPAYPRLGRTVREGRLFVNGIPVEETAFAQDPLDPVREGRIAALLALQGAPLERIMVHEGESNDDLERAADALLAEPRPRLAAGPVGLLAVLARRLAMERRPQPLPPAPDCLVIQGSAHPASRAQIEAAQAAGVFTGGWRLATAADSAESAPALIVFGGDTAREVLRRFGDPPLYPAAEILPGVAASWLDAGGSRRLLITKAGGYGSPDLLVRLAEMLRRGSSPG